MKKYVSILQHTRMKQKFRKINNSIFNYLKIKLYFIITEQLNQIQNHQSMNFSPLQVTRPHILSSCNKKNKEHILRDIKFKNHSEIYHINLSFSFLGNWMPDLPPNIVMITANNCHIQNVPWKALKNIVYIQMKNNSITQLIPNVSMVKTTHMNFSHNKIQKLHKYLLTNCPNLAQLIVDHNQIYSFDKEILVCKTMRIAHQLFTQQNDRQQLCQNNMKQTVYLPNILKKYFTTKKSEKIMDTIEKLVQSENIIALDICLEFTNKQFNQQLLRACIKDKKYKIVGSLLKKLKIQEGYLWQRLILCDINLFTQKLIKQIDPIMLIQAISLTKSSLESIQKFLRQLKQRDFVFFHSQGQLINILSRQTTGEAHKILILDSLPFFENYSFENQIIVGEILKFDCQELLKQFLQYPLFSSAIFHHKFFKLILKPRHKTYRYLVKLHKKYVQEKLSKKCYHFPQYSQSKDFFVRNDLYDYRALYQYEAMQCSFRKKNLKMTYKRSNKENYVSVAKKIDEKISMSEIFMKTKTTFTSEQINSELQL